MNNDQKEILILKHLSNDISEKEQEQLMLMLKNDIFLQELYNIYSEIWNMPKAAKLLKNNTNTNEQLSIIKNKLDKAQRKSLKLQIALKYAVTVAAVIFFVYTICTWNNVNDSELETDFMMEVAITQDKAVENILLADGTKVLLNANSELKYFKSNRCQIRRVYLKGQAYFEVAKDSQRPFIVQTGKIETKVLGTQFDVRTFTNGNINIGLFEGAVVVFNDRRELASLTPGNMLNYHSDNSFKISDLDAVQLSSWRRKDLVFEQEKLGIVCKQLQRSYGIPFNLDSTLTQIQISAKFKSTESVSEILNAISFACDIKYEINNKYVTINKK